jgi:hypothetical protein
LVSGEIAMRALALLPLLLLLPACGLEPVTAGSEQEGPVSFGALTLSQDSVDFGQVSPDDSGVVTLTLSNTGEIPLGILDAQIDTSFFLVEDAASMLPSEIEADSELSMNLVFTPDREMDFEGTLTIVTDLAEASEITVDLIGSGAEVEDTGDTVGGQLSLSASSIDFGDAEVGEITASPLAITNSGDEDILIINFSGSSSEWGYGGELALPYVLGAGQTRDVTLTVEPSAETSISGTITLISDATGGDIEIPVSAVGVDLCDICAPILELICDECGSGGNLVLSNLTKTKSLTMVNYGDESLIIDNVVLDYTNTDCPVTMSGWGGSKTLAPGSTHELTFTGSKAGTTTCFAAMGEVNISSNGGSATQKIQASFF